jgi:hypothetical protein
MRLTKYNPETAQYELKEKARTQAEFNAQRKTVIQRLGEFEDRAEGEWLSAYEYAIKLGETNQYRLGIAEHDKIWHFCSLCEQQVRFKRNFCPNCGAKMKGENDEQI